eukprot:jgi/Mesvir1/1718/Mv21171-RA.1
MQTEAVRNTLTPKWVKDFKLSVPSSTSILTVEVRDEDSVSKAEEMGKVAIPLSEIISAGTQVQWYKLKNAKALDAGEICLVLRYIPIASPSKAGAPAPASAPAAKPTPAITATAAGDDAAKADAAASKAAQANGAAGDTSEAGKGVLASVTGAAGDALGKVKGALEQEPVKKGLIGVAVAAVFFLTSKSLKGGSKRVHQVVEGDTLCAIGSCFNKSWQDIYRTNREVTDNPDKIYPGNRIVIPK